MGHRGGARRRLDRVRGPYPHGAGLRRLRLAGVGPPDAALEPRHQRGALVEAADVPVRAPLRAVRPHAAVAVDGHRRHADAGRERVCGPDRLPAHRPEPEPSLRPIRGGRVRRPGPAGDRRLLAPDRDRQFRSDRRDSMPGGDRLSPVPAAAAGARGTGAGVAGAPRGVAIRRPVCDLVVPGIAWHPDPGRCRDRVDPAAVVRDLGTDRQRLAAGRGPGAELRQRDPRQQVHRRCRPPDRPVHAADANRGRAGADPGRHPAGPRLADARGGSAAVGGGRDRIRTARVVGGSAVPVRACGRADHAGRRRGRPGAGVRAAGVRCAALGRARGGRDPADRADPDHRTPDRRASRPDRQAPRRAASAAPPAGGDRPARRTGRDPRLRTAGHAGRVAEHGGLGDRPKRGQRRLQAGPRDRPGDPIVVLKPHLGGWQVRPVHTLPVKQAACASLHTDTEFSPS